MSYNPADPMILLYNPLEKLKKMAEAANIAYTEAQILDMGLTVIRNTRDFEKALGDWDSLAARNKTWDRFKQHFKDAQKQLKAIRGLTMQQAGYHHANSLAQQLRSDIQQRDQDLLTVLQHAIETNSTASPRGASQPSVAPTEISTVTSHQPHVNAVQTDHMQLEILKILQQIQQTMTVQQPHQQPNPNTGRTNRTPRKTRDDATFRRNNTSKYCWTHGGCGHDSASCKAKAQVIRTQQSLRIAWAVRTRTVHKNDRVSESC